MTLREYLFHKRIKVKDFALALGCSYVHLMQIKNGNRKPSKILAKAIQEITKGEVKIEDFFESEEKSSDGDKEIFESYVIKNYRDDASPTKC